MALLLAGGSNISAEQQPPPLALTYRITTKFDELPTWNYPLYLDIYCAQGQERTVTGERHPLVGAYFIASYIVFLAVNIPPMIVMARPKLLQHSCYKLMFMLSALENVTSFVVDLMAGLFSILGTNYCDNPRLLVVTGHVVHSVWYCYCFTGVILAFNRYVELKSPAFADRLFTGNRTWLWCSAPFVYGILLSSSLDIPVIYNSALSVFLFQIEVRGPQVTNWFCVFNSVSVMSALIIIYSLLLLELHNKAKAMSGSTKKSDDNRAKMERKVRVQCFFICVLLFIVLSVYGASNFMPLPVPPLMATIFMQMCNMLTSLVYILFNSAIRQGVWAMLFGRFSSNQTASSTSHYNTANTTGAGSANNDIL